MRIGGGPARGDETGKGLRHEDRARLGRHLARGEPRVARERLEPAIGISDRTRGVALGKGGDEGRAQLRDAVEARQEDDLGGARRAHSRW